MFTAVLDVVKIFREKKRSKVLEDGFYENRSFFEHVQFFRSVESDFPGVQVCIDFRKQKVIIKGQGDEFYKACEKCNGLLKKMVKNKKKSLKDKRMWDILSQKMELVEEKLKSENIKAKVCSIL